MSAGAHPRLVTLSAPYGAGGSEIGPRLAERLGVPFVDRAIPVAVAARLDVDVEEAVGHEGVASGTWSRWLAHFAPAVQMFGGAPLQDPIPSDDEAFRRATEQVLREYAAQGAVILGRAGAVVLREAPGALHVRLDGPPDARLRQAMALRSVDEATAEEEMRAADAARETYVRHWYRVDPRSCDLYHLVLDSTAVALDTCVELIALAVSGRR